MNIIQPMKRQDISGKRLPALKGHLSIRLHNPTTGKTEVIEGDNMMTNALNDIFGYNFFDSIDYSSLTPIWSKMLGGVLCFHNSLDVSSEGAADDYHIPDNAMNTVIAHAGQTAYTDQADDIKRGNPLSTSMTITDDTVTLAWEWGSAAGNGLISSVALTHSDIGDAGTGSESNVFRSLNPFIRFDNSRMRRNARVLEPYIFILGRYDNSRVVAISKDTTNNNRVKVYIASELVLSANLNGGISIDNAIEYATIKNISFEENVNIILGYYYDSSNKIINLFKKISNTKIRRFIIDIEAGTMSSSDINSDGVNFSDFGSAWNGYECIPVVGGYAFFRTNSGSLKVKLSSPADQTSITYSNIEFSPVYNYDGNILVCGGHIINNNIAYKTQKEYQFNFGGNQGQMTGGNIGRLASVVNCIYDGSANYSQPGIAISKFYLGTKFNLPSPVTKTTSQSMVVTYTLTEA